MNITSIHIHNKEIPVIIGKQVELLIKNEGNKYTFFYPCHDSNDCSPYYIRLPAGSYIFEVWGARGGKGNNINNPDGGLGGYAKGSIRLRHDTDAFLQIGNKGETGSGGYNGGGYGKEGIYIGGGGGGASDIWLLQNKLGNRVIVAGGGGGTEHCDQRPVYSWGGGLEGGLAYSKMLNNQGKQNIGGINGGAFGIGGSTPNNDSGGGGGGWYGGGYGSYGSDGGGGSGFVFTEIPNIDDPFYLDLQYQLTNTQLLSGNESFYRPNSDGRGAAAIAFLSFYSSTQKKYCYLSYFYYICIFLIVLK